MSYADTLVAEVDSWIIEDPEISAEKLQRERIRHHKLVRDLLLDKLNTAPMRVLEVGGGPYPVSDLIEFSSRVVVDPCTDAYRRQFPCPDHTQMKIEDMPNPWRFDLVISTNSLDHVERPATALRKIGEACRPGGYVAIMCAENNAITNPHPAHVHNLTARDVHQALDADYETVWELTYAKDGYRYGWVPFEGKRGQPAFALLMRNARPLE